MKAKDIMTSTIIAVSPEDTVEKAVRLMLQNRISGLPVIDAASRLIGIVTEGDFLRRVETATQRKRPRWLEFMVGPGRLADEYMRSHARKVSEIMTAEPATVTEDTALEAIVTLMEKRRIKRVPVVRSGKVVGLISRANLLRALAGVSRGLRPGTAGDQAIRDRILAELKAQPWAPVAIEVVVRSGIVDLWGTITDERTRQALIVAAENVPGVKRVRDHIVWLEATSGMLFEPPNEVKDVSRPAASTVHPVP
jgi:CBS domain-containing protein